MISLAAGAPLFDISFEVVKPMTPVPSSSGRSWTVARINGGAFEGPALSGAVLHGEDWLLRRADGVIEFRASAVLESSSGDRFALNFEGLRDASPEVIERALAGETVDASEYYWTVFARFDTGAPALDWLNRIVAVGHGRWTEAGAAIDFSVA